MSSIDFLCHSVYARIYMACCSPYGDTPLSSTTTNIVLRTTPVLTSVLGSRQVRRQLSTLVKIGLLEARLKIHVIPGNSDQRCL